MRWSIQKILRWSLSRVQRGYCHKTLYVSINYTRVHVPFTVIVQVPKCLITTLAAIQGCFWCCCGDSHVMFSWLLRFLFFFYVRAVPWRMYQRGSSVITSYSVYSQRTRLIDATNFTKVALQWLLFQAVKKNVNGVVPSFCLCCVCLSSSMPVVYTKEIGPHFFHSKFLLWWCLLI